MPSQKRSPMKTVDPAEAVAQPSGGRCQCGGCAKTYQAGAVVTDDRGWDDEHQCFSVMRRLYCDHCDHIQVWMEALNRDGELSGMVLSGPGYQRGRRDIERFLREHPEATGVVQS